MRGRPSRLSSVTERAKRHAKGRRGRKAPTCRGADGAHATAVRGHTAISGDAWPRHRRVSAALTHSPFKTTDAARTEVGRRGSRATKPSSRRPCGPSVRATAHRSVRTGRERSRRREITPEPARRFSAERDLGNESKRRGMSPDDRLRPRISRCHGFCRSRAKSFRHTLRADVVGPDERDKPIDGTALMCPGADGCRGVGRISIAPVRPYQGPAKLGLSMTSRVCQSRGRPAACVEDHETRLADHPPVGRGGLENERTEPVGAPGADCFFDHGSRFLEPRDRFLAQAAHDLRVCKQVVQSLRIPSSRRTKAEPVRMEAEPLPG